MGGCHQSTNAHVYLFIYSLTILVVGFVVLVYKIMHLKCTLWFLRFFFVFVWIKIDCDGNHYVPSGKKGEMHNKKGLLKLSKC